jgi:sugar lactone lactonase YvrE
MVVPNGLALDRRGALFVSDSALGEIWRIPRRARVGSGNGEASPWLSHPLLAGCQPNQLGANGVAYHRGALYVANSERGLLVRVPVRRDGSPGTPVVVAGDEDCDTTDALYGLDGIAIDRRGRVYGALVLQHRLVKIDPRTGTSTVLLDEDDGLWNPASVAFGPARRDRDRLFITNYAVLAPEPTANLGPAVLTYRIGLPGWPRR